MTTAPNPNAVDTDTLTGQMRPIRRAALGLGSNVGERLEALQTAVNVLTESSEIVPVAVSSVYETAPVGGPEGQPDFLNAVLVVDTSLDSRDLLERALATEDALGRSREVTDGPRTLDVDVLAVGDREVRDDDLTVPHPRLTDRAFVLVPWAEVDPTFAIPGLGTVLELRSRVSDTGIKRLTDRQLDLPV